MNLPNYGSYYLLPGKPLAILASDFQETGQSFRVWSAESLLCTQAAASGYILNHLSFFTVTFSGVQACLLMELQG